MPIDTTAGRVARSFAALGLGEAVSRLIGFFATIYGARVLGAGGYGIVGVAAAVILYFNRVADMGFELGLGLREIAADPRFVETAAPSVLVLRTALSAGLAFLGGGIALLLFSGVDGAVIATQGFTLLAVGIGTRWIHLGYHRSGISAAAVTAGQLVMAGLVILLVRSPADVGSMPAAQIVGDLTAATILMLAFRRFHGALPARLDWAVLKPLLPRAWHLVSAALVGIVIYSSGLLLLRNFKDAAAAGYYAAAYTLITFFINVGAMYNLSLLPSLTRLANDRAEQLRLYHTAIAQVFAVGLPIALGGTLLAGPVIGLVLGPGYTASIVPFTILVWSIPINLVRGVPLMALLSERRERTVFRITLWSGILSVALGLALVPRFGLAGGATATLAAELMWGILSFWHAQRLGFRFPGIGRFGRALLAGGLMGVAVAALAPNSLWLGVPVGGLGYLVGLSVAGGLRYRRGGWPEVSV